MIAKINKTEISAKNSTVILDFDEQAKKRQKIQGKFPRANMHTGIFRRVGVLLLYYQILMIAKINKTKISAKIMKSKKIEGFIFQKHQKLISTRPG